MRVIARSPGASCRTALRWPARSSGHGVIVARKAFAASLNLTLSDAIMLHPGAVSPPREACSGCRVMVMAVLAVVVVLKVKVQMQMAALPAQLLRDAAPS